MRHNGKLKRTVRDKAQRVVLRQTFENEQEALAALGQWITHQDSRPEGWRLLRIGLFTRPERGAKVELDLQWVSEKWWHEKRLNAGRSRQLIDGQAFEDDARDDQAS